VGGLEGIAGLGRKAMIAAGKKKNKLLRKVKKKSAEERKRGSDIGTIEIGACGIV